MTAPPFPVGDTPCTKIDASAAHLQADVLTEGQNLYRRFVIQEAHRHQIFCCCVLLGDHIAPSTSRRSCCQYRKIPCCLLKCAVGVQENRDRCHQNRMPPNSLTMIRIMVLISWIACSQAVKTLASSEWDASSIRSW